MKEQRVSVASNHLLQANGKHINETNVSYQFLLLKQKYKSIVVNNCRCLRCSNALQWQFIFFVAPAIRVQRVLNLPQILYQFYPPIEGCMYPKLEKSWIYGQFPKNPPHRQNLKNFLPFFTSYSAFYSPLNWIRRLKPRNVWWISGENNQRPRFGGISRISLPLSQT